MSDSTLYLYTSLTAGSSHIVTATARLETILKANKLPFKALDVATDEAARKLWGRRAKGKKLPGLVKYGTVVGDLEQIEEWNEFGELRMEVNAVQDLDSVSATATPPAPAPVDTQAANNPTESESATPKPSTIKIQSPPATKPAEKKDEQAVLALRQASSEAAAKAKNKSEEKKDVSSAEPTKKIDAEEAESKPLPVHRRSVAPELPDTAPGSPKVAKRPPLVPEVAAESSANFHADNAEALGLVQHHRGSIISTGDKAEQEKAVHVIRESVSKDEPDRSLDEVRKEAAQKAQEEKIEETIEEPQPSAEETKDDTQDEDKGESKEEPKATDPAPKEDSQPGEDSKAAE